MEGSKGRKGKGKRGPRGPLSEAEIAARVDKEKDKWLTERQAQLDAVEEKHDELVRVVNFISCMLSKGRTVQVREMFHLNKFVSLLTYNPVVRV